ncbi:MAG: DUF3488 and transglutaminase-like domain-containing protein [Acidobacteriota bacterium]
MTFGQEKRRLLGWLALFMPIPLPLNDVLEWPVLFVYAFLVIVYLQRVERGAERWLPNWALNVLGAVYLPILLVDIRWGVMRDQVVKSLLHLILFLVVVKLFSIRKEKEKWHVFTAVFFIFVAAMATSSNLTISLYLLGAIGLGFFVLARFAHLHVLAALGRRSIRQPVKAASAGAPPFPPARSMLAVAMLAIIGLSIPLFAAMPRMRQPFVMGEGAGNLGLSRTTGFSDQVDLSLTSEIRGNRAIALRLQAPRSIGAGQLRLKAATYDFYRDRNWYRHPREQRGLIADRGGLFLLPSTGEDEVGALERIQVFLEPLNSTSLVVPVETGAMRIDGRRRRLLLDAGGALLTPGLPPRRTIQYDVYVDERPRFEGVLRDDVEPPVDALDIVDLSPRVIELAASVMGEGSDAERLDRLLRHLLDSYAYTLDFVGRDGQTPLEDFLFEHRSGHCEYFASAMVLMARSQGIPARLVTGFLGAELNPLEDLYVVRQQNAHAWVEAWTAEQGWQVFDPTPPEGRPGAVDRDLALIAQQIWDYLTFRWDRYVLTYGADDQRSIFEDVRDRVRALWERFRDWRDAEDPREVPPFQISEADPDKVAIVSRGSDARPIWQSPTARYGGLAIFTLIVFAGVAYWRLWPETPEQAYARLRKGLAARDVDVEPSLAPFELRDRLVRDHPRAADDVRALIAAYVASSFAERPLVKGQDPALRPTVGRILDIVRDDRKAATRQARRAATVRSG